MVQIRSAAAMPAARLSASSNNEWPPRSEQNCLGTEVPHGRVVRERRRLPSPPARTKAHTCGDLASSASTHTGEVWCCIVVECLRELLGCFMRCFLARFRVLAEIDSFQ